MALDVDNLLSDIEGIEDVGELDECQMSSLIDLMADSKTYIENLLKIQDKRNNLVPLVFNSAQNKLYDEYMRQKKLGQPIRIIILKARQMGFSTAVSALFYHSSATNENTNSAVIAHKNEASTNILEKMRHGRFQKR